jgi:hypothetical protein
VVRSETRTYVLPSADATGDQEVATYNALQRNCYEAARNNQYGEYPALQQMACTRYAQFASQKGWDAGTLPAYGVPAPPATPAARVIEPAAPSQPSVNTCAALIAEKENINEHMRSGPGYGEPQGTRLRLRLHEIDDSLYALHCKLT